MRSIWWVVFLVACGNSSGTTHVDARLPDVAVVPDAPGCMAGAACSTNPGAPCVTGVTSCQGNQASCVDGPDATEGTTCTAGTCERGACLAAVDVAIDANLSSTPVTAGRTCAESPAYSVATLASTSATLSSAPATGCLATGDEVLLINLQGSTGATANVGNWELLEIASASGTAVTFTAAKTRSYGSTAGADTAIGTGSTDQKVALIRVAQFGSLTIDDAKTLTVDPWNGLVGGVLAIRAASLTVNGTISVAGLGYRGGKWSQDGSCSTNLMTEAGESIAGLGTPSTSPNNGGAGGIGVGTASFNGNTPLESGASHATVGESGSNGQDRTIGGAGTVYGTNDATTLTLGSGQGGNLTCDSTVNAARLIDEDEHLAGGIVLLLPGTLTLGANGKITASGKASARDVSASGGEVFIKGGTLALGTGRVTAIGGTGTGVNGPTLGMTVRAGDGYIVVKGTTATGTTTPAAHVL